MNEGASLPGQNAPFAHPVRKKHAPVDSVSRLDLALWT